MRKIFADTHYWVAVIHPRDPWRQAAQQARTALGNVILVTTDEVLSEVLDMLSKNGEQLRRFGVATVEQILNNPNVRVLPQTRDSFSRALTLYKERPDKNYSLTDCVSMNAMREHSISDILTNDHGFQQEGFTVLIQQK